MDTQKYLHSAFDQFCGTESKRCKKGCKRPGRCFLYECHVVFVGAGHLSDQLTTLAIAEEEDGIFGHVSGHGGNRTFKTKEKIITTMG